MVTPSASDLDATYARLRQVLLPYLDRCRVTTDELERMVAGSADDYLSG